MTSQRAGTGRKKEPLASRSLEGRGRDSDDANRFFVQGYGVVGELVAGYASLSSSGRPSLSAVSLRSVGARHRRALSTITAFLPRFPPKAPRIRLALEWLTFRPPVHRFSPRPVSMAAPCPPAPLISGFFRGNLKASRLSLPRVARRASPGRAFGPSGRGRGVPGRWDGRGGAHVDRYPSFSAIEPAWGLSAPGGRPSAGRRYRPSPRRTSEVRPRRSSVLLSDS